MKLFLIVPIDVLPIEDSLLRALAKLERLMERKLLLANVRCGLVDGAVSVSTCGWKTPFIRLV